jgi:predicted amidohydrolase YtcJ
MNLVKAVMPADDDATLRRKFLQAVEDCLAKGLTGVHEAGVGPREIALYKTLIDEGAMSLRLYAMLGDQANPVIEGDLAAWFQQNKVLNYGGRNYLDVRCVKLFFDGALGSRGAAFFEAYEDDPGNAGLLRITPDYIYEVTRAALAQGMQVGTHCIGIRGNRLCLEAYGRALADVPVEDHRLRIEHAQVVRPEDVTLFARLGVLPAMQPTHCTSDMPFVEDRIGPRRARGAYAWRWFRDAGLVIPCGSDFPVESNDPLKGIYAAVTRQDAQGAPAGGWNPEQRLTREEAIRGFTAWPAYAAFQEKTLGSIEPGKLADFTVLDTDILTVPAAEILTARVRYTIVGGSIRYAR